MKPFNVFIFGFCIVILIALLSLYFRNNPPKLLGYTFIVPAFSSNENKVKYKDISQIIKLSRIISDTTLKDNTGSALPETKTSQLNKTKFKRVKPGINADSIRFLIRPVEFPQGMDTLLFPFFRILQNLKNENKLIRILHYGDSQIEGDRITSYFRNQLQTKFGGSGIGLLPVISFSPASMSYVYSTSGNWTKVSLYASKTIMQNHKKYGALINFAFLGDGHDIQDKEIELDGSIELKHSNLSYPLTQYFQLCQFYYGFNKTPVLIQLKRHKQIIDADFLPPSSEIRVKQWNVKWPVNDLVIEIKGNSSPYVYGIALDASQGVAVDNIPLRGSSGLEFTKMDMAFLHNFYNLLNVKLLILQFGVNIVPNVTDNYNYYYREFIEQLKLLKDYNPGLAIIVIGVSDVSRAGKNGFESYPNIEKIRDVQKKAAFETGCAFWDIFEAMGGQNSMPSWVLANPPLAQKDFIHFNPLGAKIIGEMFYRSFIREYDKFANTLNIKDEVMLNDK